MKTVKRIYNTLATLNDKKELRFYRANVYYNNKMHVILMYNNPDIYGTFRLVLYRQSAEIPVGKKYTYDYARVCNGVRLIDCQKVNEIPWEKVIYLQKLMIYGLWQATEE